MPETKPYSPEENEAVMKAAATSADFAPFKGLLATTIEDWRSLPLNDTDAEEVTHAA